jgi:hypothetical protein
MRTCEKVLTGAVLCDTISMQGKGKPKPSKEKKSQEKEKTP